MALFGTSFHAPDDLPVHGRETIRHAGRPIAETLPNCGVPNPRARVLGRDDRAQVPGGTLAADATAARPARLARRRIDRAAPVTRASTGTRRRRTPGTHPWLFAVAALALAPGPAAARPAPIPAPAPAPAFDPVAFFTGRTEGVGTLKILLRRAASVHVLGRGTPTPGGGIVLDQRVSRAGRPPSTRQWRLSPIAPGRYAGTLTDARGPVTADSVGGRLHIAYRSASGGVAIEQWLTLAPDGRSARNLLVARKLGLVVARLDETIRRLD